MHSSRGHPTTRLILFCIAAFFAGRFLQLPGLPDAGRGVRQAPFIVVITFLSRVRLKALHPHPSADLSLLCRLLYTARGRPCSR